MKKFFNFLNLALALFLLGSCSADPALRIGVQPNEATRDVEGFETALSKALGQKVKVMVSESYEKAMQDLKEGRVEFSILSPLNLVNAQKAFPIKVLLKKVYGESEFYFSSIVVRADSKLRKLSQLKGKRFGWVDEKSASGYLYPQVMLKEAGIDLDGLELSFHGTHEKSLLALKEGKVDAVAVWADPPEGKTGAWTDKEVFPDGMKEFRVLKYSNPIPNDGIVTSQDFYKDNPEQVLGMMNALIELSEQKNGILKKVFGVDRLATATLRHYDSVEALSQHLGSTVPGN